MAAMFAPAASPRRLPTGAICHVDCRTASVCGPTLGDRGIINNEADDQPVASLCRHACRLCPNGLLFSHRLCGRLWGMAGTTNLRANVLSMAAGKIAAWWTGRLSVFWRVQIAGWSLFFVLDLMNRLLTYHNAAMAIVVSLVVAPCLVALSTALGAIYSAQRIGDRLTPRSVSLIMLLSAGAAAIAVSVGFVARRLVGWEIPD